MQANEQLNSRKEFYLKIQKQLEALTEITEIVIENLKNDALVIAYEHNTKVKDNFIKHLAKLGSILKSIMKMDECLVKHLISIDQAMISAGQLDKINNEFELQL